jgi:dephospho-CoA kinase
LSRKKIKIAVTGSIGSGKSEFCRFISEMDYPVIYADDISKKILLEDDAINKKIIKEFGTESYINNEINKKFLADKVFSNPVNLSKINSILHPEVIKKIKLLMQEYLQKHNIVFTEAALIYEADMEAMFDYVVLVTADYQIRMKRATADGKITEEEFKKRNENQIKDEEKKKRADFVFENNTTIETLRKKADFLVSVLQGLI